MRVTTPFLRPMRRLGMAAAVVIGLLTASAMSGACAQSLTVLPVNIVIPPGQMAASLTVINHGDDVTSIQVRVLAWAQPSGTEQLTQSDEVLASPPIATIAPGAPQVIRLVLRHRPQLREATYRILLDQIPPAAAPGTVRVALRLSIPVFAQPASRVLPHVMFHLQDVSGQMALIMYNDGGKHMKLGKLSLRTAAGAQIPLAEIGSPYLLAGTSKSWRLASDSPPFASDMLHVTGQGEDGPVDQPVDVLAPR